MSTSAVVDFADAIMSYGVDRFMEDNNISVVENKSFDKLKVMATIDMGFEKSTIFVKCGLQEHEKKFYVLHELGHYVNHFEDGVVKSFYLSRYKNRAEKEANLFACIILLNNDYSGDIISKLTSKGVPENIAFSSFEELVSNSISYIIEK